MPSATPSPAWDGRRPATGTEAEATALLGWLTDPEAPRLCLVTGAPGSGKTALLGWFAKHGPRAGRPRRRTARVLVPLAGQSALGATWTIADRLGVVARSPGDLVHALATSEARPTGRAVLLLTDLHAAAEPAALTDLIAELAGVGRVRLVVEARSGTPAPAALRRTDRRVAVVDLDGDTEPAGPAAPEPPGPLPDLSDPVAVCTADPLLVTTAYVTGSAAAGLPGTLDGPEVPSRPGENAAEDHGGLRAAWMRAGQSLCREQGPAERALVLLSALGDGADPRLRPALAELAEGSPWRLRWARHRGDLTPPWPGPVTVLGSAGGPLEERSSWATAPAPYDSSTRPTRARRDAWRTPFPAGSPRSRPRPTGRCCSWTTGGGCTPYGERRRVPRIWSASRRPSRRRSPVIPVRPSRRSPVRWSWGTGSAPCTPSVCGGCTRRPRTAGGWRRSRRWTPRPRSSVPAVSTGRSGSGPRAATRAPNPSPNAPRRWSPCTRRRPRTDRWSPWPGATVSSNSTARRAAGRFRSARAPGPCGRRHRRRLPARRHRREPGLSGAEAHPSPR